MADAPAVEDLLELTALLELPEGVVDRFEELLVALDREVALLHGRVTASRNELNRVPGTAVPEAIRRLGTEVVEHRASVPPSPSIHKYHGQKVDLGMLFTPEVAEVPELTPS